jgi:NAD(P)H dehydrogenase (quinone)
VVHSRTGNTFRLAQALAGGARRVPGAVVELKRVAEITPEADLLAHEQIGPHFREIQQLPVASAPDVLACDVVVLGSPTRFGSASAEMKQLIDQLAPFWLRGELRDKVGAAFTSASTLHGGHEMTLMSLLVAMIHLGMVVVTPGYTDPIYDVAGAPYGATATTRPARVRVRPTDDDLTAAAALGERVARIGARLLANDGTRG